MEVDMTVAPVIPGMFDKAMPEDSPGTCRVCQLQKVSFSIKVPSNSFHPH